jgi:flavin reductase (DIM6/NTAB) family NADH-FMN oxidoreductase RutF
MVSNVGLAEFRTVMGRLAGAVNIVAAGSSAGQAGWRGLTATAVCSLCAEPPSLLVCLNRVSGTFHQLRQEGAFSVNILASHHVELARTFAGYDGLVGASRFGSAGWEPGTLPVPVLTDALASFECRVSRSFEYGTHAMLIGDIERTRMAEGDAEPLIYHDRRFHELGRQLEVTGGATA